jgi:hypothetical protein
VKVVVVLARLTAPFRVSANGAGKVTVMAGAARLPVK